MCLTAHITAPQTGLPAPKRILIIVGILRQSSGLFERQQLLQPGAANLLNITRCFSVTTASKLPSQPEGNGEGIHVLIIQQAFKHQESLKTASIGRRDTRTNDEEIGVR